MSYTIKNNQEASRFETTVEQNLCELNYSLADSVMTMNRVYVPPPVEGRGIASALTRFALDDCTQNNFKVIPRCPYVAAWIQRHAEYQPLIHHPGQAG